jgi:hypothetical protein
MTTELFAPEVSRVEIFAAGRLPVRQRRAAAFRLS